MCTYSYRLFSAGACVSMSVYIYIYIYEDELVCLTWPHYNYLPLYVNVFIAFTLFIGLSLNVYKPIYIFLLTPFM